MPFRFSFRLAAVLFVTQLCAQEPTHGSRPQRLWIRNAIVIEGNGTPAAGPRDIVIEGNTITRIAPSVSTAPVPAGTQVIDARGRYVMPGLINAHGHIQDERAGIAMAQEFQFKLWLSAGITTIRDLGSDFTKSKVLKERSEKGEIEAPRIFLYMVLGRGGSQFRNEDEVRARVREIKAMGADGIKFFDMYRDLMGPMLDEAHKQGLRTAHHAAVAETNAWDDIRFGTTTIEHWYGIPEAAFDHNVQNFPAGMNIQREIDRFRWAGRLWREANPARLSEVLEAMVKAGVAWDPTLSIYEASRDLLRYQNQPWFRDYLHPALERFFSPNPEFHGSYFGDWTSTDEAAWRENYRIWMAAVREFGRKGGLIGIGEDAGFIYNIYGFGLIRGMELHQEAGFHPLQVIQHATANNGRILGQESRLGRIRVGFAADVLVVNGNPLEDFKILYPKLAGEQRETGIEWVVKDGIPYQAPRLAAEARDLVKKARAVR